MNQTKNPVPTPNSQFNKQANKQNIDLNLVSLTTPTPNNHGTTVIPQLTQPTDPNRPLSTTNNLPSSIPSYSTDMIANKKVCMDYMNEALKKDMNEFNKIKKDVKNNIRIWYYIDSMDQLQGPFRTDEIFTWRKTNELNGSV